MEDVGKHSKVLSTTLKLIYPKYHPFWVIFYMYVLYIRTVKRKKQYKIRSVSSDVIKKHVKNYNYFSDDFNNIVLVAKHNVYRSDKLLKLFCEANFKYRSVYILPISEWDDDAVAISENLQKNLSNDGICPPVRLLLSNMNCNKLASEIHISLIEGPIGIGTSNTDAILKRYLTRPKLIKKGDIVEIDLKFFAKDILLIGLELNTLKCLYVECHKVIVESKEVLESCYCVFPYTRILQSPNVNSFIPQKTSKVVSKENSINFKEIPLCPYGLKPYLDEIHRAVHPFILSGRNSKLRPVFLLTGSTGSGKDILLSCLAARLGMHYSRINNYTLMSNVYCPVAEKLKERLSHAKSGAPCIIAIHNFENFGKSSEDEPDERMMHYFAEELDLLFEESDVHSLNSMPSKKHSLPNILFCCSKEESIHSSLKKRFLQIFEIGALTESQREQNLRWILDERYVNTEADLARIANETHGFHFGDLRALVYYAEKNAMLTSSGSGEINIDDDNFTQAIEHMQKNYNESVGAPKVPKVLWSDVGGLGDVKEEIIKTITLPLKYPEFFKKSGLNRSGILLFGPPGTGKTLIAKAVATECNICFLSVKGPELLNKYVGQSEHNIREVFARARAASPCIIFFDELDSLAPNRGKDGDSGGIMDRIVSQLLAEMDGLNESANLFIIGATNRPDLIDPALLRPGRFDKLLYIGPCTDQDSKISVLKALTRQFNLDDDVDLAEIVNTCPENISGADFYGVCSSAWSSAARRLVCALESGEILSQNVTHEDVMVNFQDFEVAMQNVKPSISSEDLEYFNKLKTEMGSKI